MMQKKKIAGKLWTAILTMALAVGMVPGNAFAETGVGQQNADSPIHLSKTATLESDGTYTIDLEAYVTGEVITQVERKNKPTDIVLVLDQSGSMALDMSGLPNDVYTEAGAISNADAYSGSYYYKVGNDYFPVTVKYASTGNVEHYMDNAGNVYDESLVATTWSTNSGVIKEADGPYLKSSLIALYREKSWTRYYYVINGKELNRFDSSTYEASGTDQTILRNALRSKYADYTVQFDNSDYTAAVYTQLTPVYTHTYEYYYTNAEGNLVALPAIGSSNGDACPYTLYQRGDQNGKRLDVLKYAVDKFVAGVEADAKTNGIDHRIALVGFSSDSDYNNTEILTGVSLTTTSASSNSDNVYYPDGKAHNGVQYNSSDYSTAKVNALQSVTDESGKQSIKDGINALTAHGATRSDLGMQMAEDILSARTDMSRDAIVIFFTDGEPTSSSSFEDSVAADTINIAKEMKIGEEVSSAKQDKDTSGGQPTGVKLGYTASVYSVAVYDGASPTGSANINGSGATRINDFMHMVSSNYPNARGEKQGSRDWEYFREVGSNKGYYMVANNAAALSNIFATITNNIHQSVTTVNLGTESILKDILSTSFTLPEGYDVSQISVQTADYKGNNDWEDAKVSTDAKLTVSGDTIEVTNFDYSGNVVTEAIDGQAASGKKLIISIPGIIAEDDAATGTPVFTNTVDSGIYNYIDDELTKIQEFERPTVTIEKKSFVLDYGKPAALDNLGQTSTHLDNAGMNKFTSSVLNLEMKYGNVEKSDSALTYTPKTMNWDGYDKFYSFGQTVEKVNQWAKVSVIPANNVYYEDDFITDTQTGTVGIKYSGDWDTDGTSSGNTETANTENHGGWENTSLADDKTYSDGSAHKAVASDKNVATATFTFTGTGVDVYSRTDMTTGTVYAVLKGETTNITKRLIVDNESVSGTYYQIPTVSFCDDDLKYGTYTVTIKVTTAAEGRSTYYLDGIRVYNPLSTEPDENGNVDKTVSDAYRKEMNAEFTEVRDILLNAGTLNVDGSANGVVFIDKTKEGTTGANTNIIETYEDYGPKNEVYLAKNQAIAFKVNVVEETEYQLGIKAPDGNTTAQITNGDNTSEITIGAASDLYYTIMPNSDGYVMVKNTGDNLLSITKMKTIGDGGVETANVMSLCDYANEFETLEVVAYAVPKEETEEPEITEPEESIDPEPEDKPGDVVIDNPEPEDKPGDVVIDNPEPKPEPVKPVLKDWINKLFDSIRKRFK